MAYKSFTNGFPLPASDLNNFLMDQSVITFASATERDSTLTSPKEGMLTYLEDTNTYTYYDGAAWQNLVGGGDPIDQSLLTTTGDMIYASAAETAARLGIGSEGDVLSVSSGAPVWTAPSSGTPTNWGSVGTQSFSSGASVISVTGLTAAGKSKFEIEFDIFTSGACSFGFGVNGSGAYTQFPILLAGDGSFSKIVQTSTIAQNSSAGYRVQGYFYLNFGESGNMYYDGWIGSQGNTTSDRTGIIRGIAGRPTTSLDIYLTGATVGASGASVFIRGTE